MEALQQSPTDKTPVLTEADERWLEQQIEDSIMGGRRTGTKPTREPEKEGLSKTVIAIISSIITAIIIALVLGISNYAINGKIDERITEKTKHTDEETKDTLTKISDTLTGRGGVTERLSAIEGKLGMRVGIIANASPEQFAKQLPLLQQAIEDSKTTRPDAATIRLITSKLNETPIESKGYWPATLKFIEFASSALSSNSVPEPGEPSLIFRDNALEVRSATPVPFERLFPMKTRRVTLDGGELKNVVFRNYRIRFTTNEVKMENVIFIDCVFEMPSVDKPSPYIQNTVRQLLVSNFAQIAKVG